MTARNDMIIVCVCSCVCMNCRSLTCSKGIKWYALIGEDKEEGVEDEKNEAAQDSVFEPERKTQGKEEPSPFDSSFD